MRLFSILPNLKSKFGWNPAKRLTRWLTGLTETKTEDGQVTFKQVCSITHWNNLFISGYEQPPYEIFQVFTSFNTLFFHETDPMLAFCVKLELL